MTRRYRGKKLLLIEDCLPRWLSGNQFTSNKLIWSSEILFELGNLVLARACPVQSYPGIYATVTAHNCSNWKHIWHFKQYLVNACGPVYAPVLWLTSPPSSTRKSGTSAFRNCPICCLNRDGRQTAIDSPTETQQPTGWWIVVVSWSVFGECLWSCLCACAMIDFSSF